MLRRSKIGWCDYSGGDLNFVIGCTPISDGCANCYAHVWAERTKRDFSDVIIYWEKLNRLWKAKWEPGDQPYRRGPGSKPIMFPVDLGDLFHPEVPEDMILAALDIFAARDDADWVLLTKRPERMLQATWHWLTFNELDQLPPNIWCLATTENQRRANELIPILIQVKAQVRGLSVEPMLEPIDFAEAAYSVKEIPGTSKKIAGLTLAGLWDYLHWVIVGAESGPNRRHFEVAWAENLYAQCQRPGVAFFGKQDSGLRPGTVLHLPCLECGGSGYISDGLGSGEPCGCNAQRWEVKEFPTLKFPAGP